MKYLYPIHFCVYVCVYACECRGLWRPTEGSDPTELESQAVGAAWSRRWAVNPGLLPYEPSAFNCWAISTFFNGPSPVCVSANRRHRPYGVDPGAHKEISRKHEDSVRSGGKHLRSHNLGGGGRCCRFLASLGYPVRPCLGEQRGEGSSLVFWYLRT